jgi:16S rRNA (cytosine1402-N4)-methyltransferase
VSEAGEKVDLTKVEISPYHYPVMIQEVADAFAVFRGKTGLHYFDGTFGRGGHYRVMKQLFPAMQATVMDQDAQAVEYARTHFPTQVQSGELKILHANFSQFSQQIPEPLENSFDMMLLDLGVSSPQLDVAERGFSFYHDGPLDMRMNQQQALTAEVLLNTASEDQLIHIFKEYGEVYRPFRVVRAIVHDRKTQAFTTTHQLAGLIERVDGWSRKGFHPATQYFMALRLAVNSELEVVAEALLPMMKSLKDKGRLAVITFHSLEDRIVKNIFRDHKELGFPVNKKVIVPTQEECDRNSRSRSAKLRVFQKGAQDEQRKYKST